MEIQIAALCDSAVDYNGKLCLLGAFDTVLTRGLPAIHPQCSIALRIVFRKEEEGVHKVRVNIVNQDGKSIVPGIEMGMEVLLPEDFYFSTRNLVLNIQQLQFDGAGPYAIDVAVDGRQMASIPLQVVLAGG